MSRLFSYVLVCISPSEKGYRVLSYRESPPYLLYLLRGSLYGSYMVATVLFFDILTFLNYVFFITFVYFQVIKELPEEEARYHMKRYFIIFPFSLLAASEALS